MIVVGLSHRHAPIEIRERLAIAPADVGSTLQRIMALDPVTEAAFLSTCNRVEVYAAGDDEAALAAAVAALLSEIGGADVAPHLKEHRSSDAIRHLFRVACSLDSLVIGEPQVLGQLKDAISAATEHESIGPELHFVMRRALQAAKRVRTETAIGAGHVSVPSVAVELARHIFEDLQGQTALMIGAGEMAETAAKLLARAGAKLVVVNRSAKRAAKLAAAVGGTPAPWNRLDACLIEADIAIASTASPQYVITSKQLRKIRRERRGRSLFLIDIAVPRDVDPAVHNLDNVYLYDIDDLSHVVAQSMEERRTEADRAEALVKREVAAAEERRSQQAMTPVIVALREHARRLLEAELERTCRGRLKHLPEDDRDALVVMLDAAVNKLMHSPTNRLKQLAAGPNGPEVAQLVASLFELRADFEAAALSEPPPSSSDKDDMSDDTRDEGTDDNDESAAARRLVAR